MPSCSLSSPTGGSEADFFFLNQSSGADESIDGVAFLMDKRLHLASMNEWTSWMNHERPTVNIHSTTTTTTSTTPTRPRQEGAAAKAPRRCRISKTNEVSYILRFYWGAHRILAMCFFFFVVSFWCVVLFCCCCCCCCSAFLSELLPGLLSSVTEFYWVSMEWNLVKGRYRVLPGLCSVFRLITDSILGFDGIEFGKGRLPSFTEFVIECFRAITEFYWVLMEWNLGKDCYRVLPCL